MRWLGVPRTSVTVRDARRHTHEEGVRLATRAARRAGLAPSHGAVRRHRRPRARGVRRRPRDARPARCPGDLSVVGLRRHRRRRTAPTPAHDDLAGPRRARAASRPARCSTSSRAEAARTAPVGRARRPGLDRTAPRAADARRSARLRHEAEPHRPGGVAHEDLARRRDQPLPAGRRWPSRRAHPGGVRKPSSRAACSARIGTPPQPGRSHVASATSSAWTEPLRGTEARNSATAASTLGRDVAGHPALARRPRRRSAAAPPASATR